MLTTDVSSEGRYRCEVSTESPSFRTVMGEGEMRIYVNPSRKPEILGNKQHYIIGELVNVTCISAPSRPQTSLKWLINGREPPDHQLRYHQSKESPAGLFTSMQTLRFYAQQEHFLEGKMRLQCEAIISQAHTLRSDEITVSNNTTKASAITSQAFDSIQKDGPVISGGKSEYQVGDIVNVSCMASKSQPPAELQWYINDKEARPDFLVPMPPIIYKGGEISTVLGLRFEVKSLHFRRNEMRLRCTATLSEVTKMSSEPLEAEIAEQQRSDLHVDFNVESVSNSCTRRTVVSSTLKIIITATLLLSSL
ncbi:uncharacterized protein LOC129229491 [Uloborus diversus]|uniref:uncharacterized protein LOC129229491 n=1 Tax=Uloborus diversus TaxID=327109 RepID=UPI0024090933|nr:uncharacterized protein LOC129229491 [Uloborus diversus]